MVRTFAAHRVCGRSLNFCLDSSRTLLRLRFIAHSYLVSRFSAPSLRDLGSALCFFVVKRDERREEQRCVPGTKHFSESD